MSSSGRKVAHIWPVFATARLAWSDQSYKKTIFRTCTSIFWNCAYSLLSPGIYFGVWFMVGRAVLVWLSLYVWKLDMLIWYWNGLCWWIEKKEIHLLRDGHVRKVGHMKYCSIEWGICQQIPTCIPIILCCQSKPIHISLLTHTENVMSWAYL